MVVKIFLVLVAISAFTTPSYGQRISPRMMNGIPADTMRRFPHHVTIQPLQNYNSSELQMCGGSILNERWVLTTIKCVDQGETLKIDFQKLNKSNSAGSYSAVVNNDENSVTKYPTEYDDIALIKLPFRIISSDKVRPIGLSSKSPAEMQKKLGVLPGFDTNENIPSSKKDQLTYAMFSIAPNEVCQKSYQYAYDEFLNMCAVPNSRNNPCVTDFGNGLVVGWPANPKLMGIYSSASYDCDSYSPSVFTYIEKYIFWINSVIGEEPTEFYYRSTPVTTESYYTTTVVA